MFKKCPLCNKLIEIANIMVVLDNKNRQEILDLLKKNNSMTITDISKSIGIAYKNVHAHIIKLEGIGVIKTKKQEKTQGRKVMVELNKDGGHVCLYDSGRK